MRAPGAPRGVRFAWLLEPYAAAATLRKDSDPPLVIDGPFAETKEQLLGFYIVDASQRGIVLQFGRFVEATDPGLRWRLPYPVQTHELVNLTGVRTVEIGYRGSERNKVLKEALMLTDDENIVNIQFAVQYILKDPQQYLFNNRNADDSVIQAAETAVREIVEEAGGRIDVASAVGCGATFTITLPVAPLQGRAR